MAYSDIETASREDLRELQDERLAETVRYAYENVDYYREALDEAGVSPDDVESVDASGSRFLPESSFFHSCAAANA